MSDYKRSIYLINPKFQLKFSAMICLLILISSLIYPFTIMDIVDRYVSYVGQKSPDKLTELSSYKSALIYFLCLFQAGFTLLSFIICLLFTHKVAGPIYKARKYLKEIRDGQASGPLYFRQGDYFHDLAEDFNMTFSHIQENYKSDMVYLSEVSSYVNNLSQVVPNDKKIILGEIESKLNQIQDRYKSLY